mgnify:CR=1 FL=1
MKMKEAKTTFTARARRFVWPEITMMPLLILGFILFIAWAAWFSLDQSVRATGQVVSNAKTQVIQSADGGVLLNLYVHEGQEVQAGQDLAVLEKDRAEANLQEAQARVMSLKGAYIRLQAELQGTAPQFGAAFRNYPEFVAVQTGIYQQRKRTLNEELSIINDSLVLAREELNMNEKLATTGDVSTLDVLRAKRQLADLVGRESAAKNKYLQESRAEAIKTQDELSSQQYKLTERQSVFEHTRLTAPIAGVVKYLKVTTIGGVLRSGDELMQIAPSENGVVIEVKINPTDIGHLKLGLPVAVKLDAFDYSIYGTLEGELIHLSPDTLTEQSPNGQASPSFYRAKVRLNDNQSQNPKAKEMQIKLGMTASIDIRNGHRSVLSYLLKPIIKNFSGALTER